MPPHDIVQYSKTNLDCAATASQVLTYQAMIVIGGLDLALERERELVGRCKALREGKAAYGAGGEHRVQLQAARAELAVLRARISRMRQLGERPTFDAASVLPFDIGSETP